jgi:hypothetical protein
MRHHSPAGLPPLPWSIEQSHDPTYGYGSAVYHLAPDTTALFRYQTCRRFDGQPWRTDLQATLVVLGLHPDHRGTAGHLDHWLQPYAQAAIATGFEQLAAVCLYAGLVERLPNDKYRKNRWQSSVSAHDAINEEPHQPAAAAHYLHGPLNAHFVDAAHITKVGKTVVIATGTRPPCPDCLPRDIIGDLAAASVNLVTLVPDAPDPADRWQPYRQPTKPHGGTERSQTDPASGRAQGHIRLLASARPQT